MKKYFLPLIVVLAASCCRPKDGEYVLHLLTTNDVHGRYFDSTYVSDKTLPSLQNVVWYADSLRSAAGKENVILIDAGDFLQGDNAAYYYNFVDPVSEHIFSRMAEYIGYDVVVAGNHDIETGHPVYDRLTASMDVPLLAANAVRTDSRRPYFQDYVCLKKGGFKIAVIGFTNPNIKGWLSPEIWEGMDFLSLIPFAQEQVDMVRREENPDVVIVAAHAGTGNGDGSQLENQGMDLFRSLRGVDFVVCAHDHRPVVHKTDSICLINSGSHCANLGHGIVSLTVREGKVVARNLDASLLPVNKNKVDRRMQALFHDDYLAVKKFTLKEVGCLDVDLDTKDAYAGMSHYLNLLHTLSMSCGPAQISFAAPLKFNASVQKGTLVYNDLFTIYPYENQLFVISMTGKEIKDYLEYSYDLWINTVSRPGDHVLKIVNAPDPRTGQKNWSFVNRPYNFDSAAGINYTVDVTKPFGSRIIIESLADGTPFDMSASYNVAMTSYRANGGGGIMNKGAGVAETGNRVVAYHKEIRSILYDYLLTHGTIDPAAIGNPEKIGQWKFIPESVVSPAIERDMSLLFP